MGKTRICNFYCIIHISTDVKDYITGADSYKEAYEQGKSIAKQYKAVLVTVSLQGQTSKGIQQLKKDYAIIDNQGKVDHYYLNDPVPAYSF